MPPAVARLRERALHALEGGAVDERADQRPGVAGIADLDRRRRPARAAAPARHRCCHGRSAGAAWCSAGPPFPWPRRRWRGRRDRDRPRARRWRHCCRRARGSRGRSGAASRGPTARPMAVEPVAETTATRASSTSASPTSRPPIRTSDRPSGASPKRRMRARDHAPAWRARSAASSPTASTPRGRRRPARARHSTTTPPPES